MLSSTNSLLLILDEAPDTGGGGSGQPARERVLRAVQDQDGATTGVDTLTLPADYGDYDNLELVVASDAGNVTTIVRPTTAWLVAQTDGNAPTLGVLDNAEQGNRQWLTWTPSTRVLTRAGQNALDIRIQSARLYDNAATEALPDAQDEVALSLIHI